MPLLSDRFKHGLSLVCTIDMSLGGPAGQGHRVHPEGLLTENKPIGLINSVFPIL